MAHPLTRIGRRLALLGTLFLALGATTGCGSRDAKSPTPKRPIDEGRAVKIIAAAIHDAGLEPETGRVVSTSGKKVQLDVTVRDRKFGFAYLTTADVKDLRGDPMAEHDARAEDLTVRAGDGEDADVHFVALYASDYVYDDNVGEAHEATTITAENKLDRDARDFIMIVKKQGWP